MSHQIFVAPPGGITSPGGGAASIHLTAAVLDVVSAGPLEHLAYLGAGGGLALAAIGVVAGSAAVAVRRSLRTGRFRITLWMRLRLRMHPGPGFANQWDLYRRYGKPAARKVAKHGRPSLTWKARYLGPWQEYATFQGHAQGWFPRWRVFSTFEDLTVVFSAPQEGKSAKAAGSIIDAPGAVVATSIRGDLISITAGLRQQVGQVHVFNPEGVGDYASTFRWNIVAGCEDPEIAIRRGGSMVEAINGGGLSDEGFWNDQGAMILGAYLHAAGLVSRDIRSVYQWIMDRSEEPVEILMRHEGAAPNAVLQIEAYLEMPDKTRAGISTTLNRVMKFMTNPAIVDILCPLAGEGFDFVSFLPSRDTVYMVAADSETSPVSPLFVSFLTELAFHARLYPSRTGARRLDPPLTFELDEIANIAPVPLPNWASWAAGSGIRINAYLQSFAQLRDRWGEEGAETIWMASKCKVVFTATSEPELLERVSKLCGQVRVRDRDEITYDRHGHKQRRPTYTMVDVLPEADVRRLPDNRAVVIRRNARPAIVTTERAWKRPDVRRWKRSGQQIALPAPVRRVVPVPRPELADEVTRALLEQAVRDPAALRPDELASRRARRGDTDTGPLELPERGAAWAPEPADSEDWQPWPTETGSGDQHT